MPIAANLFPNPLLAACTAQQKAWHKGQKETAHLVFFAPCRVTIRRICKKLPVHHAAIQSMCTAPVVFSGKPGTYKLFFMFLRGLVTLSSHIFNVFHFAFLLKWLKTAYIPITEPHYRKKHVNFASECINCTFLLYMSSIVVIVN